MRNTIKVLLLPLLILALGSANAQDDSDEDGIDGCLALGATVGVVANVVLTDQAVDTMDGRIAAGLTSVFAGWLTNEICNDIDEALEGEFEDVAYAWGVTIIPIDSGLPGLGDTLWCMHVDQGACDPFSGDSTFQDLMMAWSIVDSAVNSIRFGGEQSNFGVYNADSLGSAFQSSVDTYEAQSNFFIDATFDGPGSP